MSKRKMSTIILFVVVVILLFVAMATSTGGDPFLSKNGLWSILPPLVAISLAFVTQNVVVSLLIGVMVGTFLISMDGFNFFYSITNSFVLATQNMLNVLADKWNAGIILQVLTIGGLVALITKLGGAKAIAEALSKKAKGAVSSQIITWICGLIIFFDDYANALIVGPIMRPITDKNNISREKLAFIIDATAAPVAGIAWISTWIGAEISYIRDGLDIAGITGVSPYNLFISTIPYRFYNILMLCFVVFTAVMLKDFGPMLTAERKARFGKSDYSQKTVKNTTQEPVSQPESGKANILNALIPLGVLVVGSFLGFYLNGQAAILESEDAELIAYLSNPLSFDAIKECFGNADASIVLFQSALLASITALIMGMITKTFNIEDGISTWVSGVKSLIITGVILILAWSLSTAIKELGTAKFLVNALSDSIPQFILPGIIFVLGAVISFATGTSYGTMGILMPLAIPFAHAVSPGNNSYLLACSSAVLTGAIFGDHCSPISDTTILSSMGADCDHIAHVKTQMLYAIVVAVVALVFGYIPLGMGVPIIIALPVSIAVIVSIIHFVGKKPEGSTEGVVAVSGR